MELVIQKAAELGIQDFFPVKSKRVIVEDKDAEIKTKRWGKIAEEASKQCKRDFLLNIKDRISLDDIRPSDFNVIYLPYEGLSKSSPGKINIIDDLKKLIGNNIDNKKPLRIGYIIGPEGGFEENEVSKLTLKGAKPISLGSNILKAETASIFLSSVIKYIASVFF
jgi:16S rRNA (uracil1498-N3)-methyltransferase